MKDKLKKSWKSWTIRFNGIAAALLAGLPMLQDNLPQLQSYVPEGFFKYMMGAVIIGNIMLRFKTNNSLADK